MAKTRRARPSIATFLSRSIVFAVAALVFGLLGSTAGAQTDGIERRHRLGAQIGGSGVLQAVYRLRVVGPIHLEVGGLAADHGGNASLGLLVGAPSAGRRWFPYVGFGGGALWAFGPQTAAGCDPKTTSDCPTVDASDSLVFLHARAGIGVALGATRRHLLSLDVGGWRGTWSKDRTDAAGKKIDTSGRTMTPMAGLSYFFAL